MSFSASEKRALGGLLLSCAAASEASLGVRPLNWYNSLCRLGVVVPLVVAHDLGAVLLGTVEKPGPSAAATPAALGLDESARTRLLGGWTALLEQVAGTEAALVIQRTNADDAMLVAVLARILAPISDRWRGARPFEPIVASADTLTEALGSLPSLWAGLDRRPEFDYLSHVVQQGLLLMLSIEQMDLDTLELLKLFGTGSGSIPDTDLVDLLNVFSSPEANDVVNFSLDILPSVLETKRGGGQQVFAVDGYSGVVANGSLDSLVMTEMAYDDDLFEQRFLLNEMLYYSHEAQVKPSARSYQILVDASASMRGARNIFARGLAIALTKRMSLLGFDASVRFFDSRLYEPLRVRRLGRNQTGQPPHIAGVLTFKGERGRNYGRVFSQFASELDRLRDRVSVTAYIITHAECHIPTELVRRIRDSAEVYGVFMLPSRGTLELEYLSVLTQYEVVTDAALRDRSERAARALDIVEAASAGVRRDSLVPKAPGTKGEATP